MIGVSRVQIQGSVAQAWPSPRQAALTPKMGPCRPNPKGERGLRPRTSLEFLTVAAAMLSELRLLLDTQDPLVMALSFLPRAARRVLRRIRNLGYIHSLHYFVRRDESDINERCR